jgi:hypothetical protein
MFIRCRDDKWFTYCNRFDSLLKNNRKERAVAGAGIGMMVSRKS